MNKIILLLLFTLTLFSGPPKFLMPEDAFKPTVKVNDKSQIVVEVWIAKDIYLYADALKLEISDGSGVSIKSVQKPDAIDHHGDMVYLSSPTFIIDLIKEDTLSGITEIEFKVSYQGCSEAGLCYEPYTDKFMLKIDTSKLGTSSANTKKSQETVELSETDIIADTIKNASLWVVLITFFGFGLLLSLTPCVFPMIPIISGVIISQGEGITTRKAFMLSLVYVLAMAVAYTFAGVLAGLFGANLQAALQNPWVIYSFAGVFVALAFSMFGFYELKIPDSVVAKVSSSGKRNGYTGVAIMGFLSALIVGPCVAAPLAGALVYIGQTGDAVLGGLALFFMSIGMGVPLIMIGVSAGKFMPKPGEWMTLVNAFFGVMMILVAIWMLEKILDDSVTMLMYAITGVGFAYFLGLHDHERQHHHVKKSIAFLIFLYSTSLIIGSMAGSSSMLTPLKVFAAKDVVVGLNASSVVHTKFIKVTSIDELDALLKKHKGKKIMVDFYADWCTSCKELEEITFNDSAILSKMDEFILIQADITANTQNEKDLSKKYGVFGPPTLLFFDENGEWRKSKTIVGYIEPESFLKHLNKL